MGARFMLAAAVATVLTGLGALSAAAQDFNAKAVSFIVGFPPGGGYDAIGRMFARVWARHLPGAPAIVVQNQPGASSLLAANLLANTAPKDGSQVALIASSAVLEPMLGNAAAKFDPNQFEWLGNLNRDTPACAAWHTSGIKSWSDLTKRKTRYGASGPAAITAQHAFFIRNVLKADSQVIMGLGGTGPIMLALQRGEVDATCGMFVSTVRSAFRSDYESGNLVVFLQLGRQSLAYFKGAQNVYDLVQGDADKQLATFVFSQTEITRPIALAPGTPATIVAQMRAAFDKAVRDPEYLADLAKAQIDGDPMSGVETAAAFKTIMSAPADVIQRSKVVLAPAKE